MEDLLEQLETRIKTLLEKFDRMQQDQQLLTHEKKQLHDKHQGAISQIERMIARLKPLEETC